MSILRRKMKDLVRVPLTELKKRARILVIDDEECSFPFDLLRKEGYSIDHWTEVKNLRDLEEGLYDIIILDITGVAKKYDKNDGLGILEHLKDVNPSQIIVAFSGQTFDLSKNRFWKLADDALAKPVDVTKCKRLLDTMIEKKMTIEHYWQGLVSILKNEGVKEKEIKKIEKKLVEAFKQGKNANIREIFRSVIEKAETISKLFLIGTKIYLLVK